ncbi:response regulator [Methylotenera sp. G11]|uniref:response regulator n=1 Tax=Methylotenera sp. G11 TaxID=1506585 RepID=UPI00068E1B2A|nr:response regulator [Methylotenera sp. G11]
MEQAISNQAITAPQILFVDDEATAVKYFQRAINSLAPVVTGSSVEEGKRLLDEHASTLLVLVSDQRMPGGYGNELLLYARTKYPHIVRILTTAYSELEQTVEAVNQGQIHRYIQKPWEISAIRMELKQALDLANLRKEHAQLLREKMMVWKKLIVSNRIGTLYSICASLAASTDALPVEAYLSTAQAKGITLPTEPDWHAMDYSDIVSVESIRSGKFGHAVKTRLEEIKKNHHSSQATDALMVLAEVLKDKVHLSDNGIAAFSDMQNFSEFLEVRTDAEISTQHASWLAFLIWLHDARYTLRLKNLETGVQFSLEPIMTTDAPASLVRWIGQLSH